MKTIDARPHGFRSLTGLTILGLGFLLSTGSVWAQEIDKKISDLNKKLQALERELQEIKLLREDLNKKTADLKQSEMALEQRAAKIVAALEKMGLWKAPAPQTVIISAPINWRISYPIPYPTPYPYPPYPWNGYPYPHPWGWPGVYGGGMMQPYNAQLPGMQMPLPPGFPGAAPQPQNGGVIAQPNYPPGPGMLGNAGVNGMMPVGLGNLPSNNFGPLK